MKSSTKPEPDFKTDYLLDKAYKKLKSLVYYDKTALPLRDELVRFEQLHPGWKMSAYLADLWGAFSAEDESVWLKRQQEILSSIACRPFPKKLETPTLLGDKEQDKQTEKSDQDTPIITNFTPEKNIPVKEYQYFIDLSVEGHILGILWVLLIGWRLDQDLTCCYGNRIRKTLYNDLSENITFSPYLFEPYFEKYESWRDTALETAQQYMEKGEDVLVMTLDFKRFYYSVDITGEFMEELFKQACPEEPTNEQEKFGNELKRRVHNFVFEVIKAYRDQYKAFVEDKQGVGMVLPIGFVPSNVLANCCLKKFDNAITDGWNPLYFGRYVDDILIVDKVQKNSDIFRHAHDGGLTVDAVISYYLLQESRWKGYDPHPKGEAIFERSETAGESAYAIRPAFTYPLGSKTHISVQNQKAKIFYFDAASTDALMTCFRENIQRNKSEFRRMPEDDAVFQRDDYTEIFELQQGGINKFRDVEGVALDKYKLSKYLGKYQRICGLVEDKRESQFIQDVRKIFSPRALLESYTLWEKVLTIFVVNGAWDALRDFLSAVEDAIAKLKDPAASQAEAKRIAACQGSLRCFIASGLARALALNWDCPQNDFNDLQGRCSVPPAHYVPTRMMDKSMCVVWPDLFLACFKGKNLSEFLYGEKINFSSPKNVFQFLQQHSGITWKEIPGDLDYPYYPYMVTMYDLAISDAAVQLYTKNQGLNAVGLRERYAAVNYRVNSSSGLSCITEYEFVPKSKTRPAKIGKEQGESAAPTSFRAIKVGNKNLTRLRIAISSIKMQEDSFEKLVKDEPVRTYQRYQQISRLVNDSISQHADILVMPEAGVPLEWLSTLARTCARNQMAVVTGVEHIIGAGGKVYNLTAVILPFVSRDFRCAHIVFHSKNHFAPDEIHQIKGFHLKPQEGLGYELYNWNDFHFSVYCCYELSSIQDRSLFQSYADAIIAVEWNHDVNYYSNIIESLSRDLHCYCVQVNSSDYGDSRITLPCKTERKDILRTKGGEEPSVLVATVDIQKLREFQAKGYELQKEDKTFKPTPPDFKHEIALHKIKKTLWPKQE